MHFALAKRHDRMKAIPLILSIGALWGCAEPAATPAEYPAIDLASNITRPVVPAPAGSQVVSQPDPVTTRTDAGSRAAPE